jgi:murein L,D-transpeptidase YcbB/YkuD
MGQLYASVWSDNLSLRKAKDNNPSLSMATSVFFTPDAITAFQNALNQIAANYGPGLLLNTTTDYSDVAIPDMTVSGGYYDLATTQAVMNFQSHRGLNADGVAGQDTLREMDSMLVVVDFLNAAAALPTGSGFPDLPAA